MSSVNTRLQAEVRDCSLEVPRKEWESRSTGLSAVHPLYIGRLRAFGNILHEVNFHIVRDGMKVVAEDR